MTLPVAIVGAGAMGKLFGARLARAGTPVTLIDANPMVVECLQRDGVSLSEDGQSSNIRLAAALAGQARGPFDAVILFTKTYHSSAAIASVRHLLAPDACILSVQNGLGNGERILAAAPGVRVAIGSTTWPADATGPASVSTHGSGEVRFWSLDGADHPVLHALDVQLSEAGMNSRLDPEVKTAIWEKVIFNCAMNPVTALTRSTVGQVAACIDGPALAQTVLAEGFQVARAAGVPVNEEHVRATVAMACREHIDHRPSMAMDVMHERRTEIDAINGALVEVARAHGISVPVNETLARLVRIIDSQRS